MWSPDPGRRFLVNSTPYNVWILRYDLHGVVGNMLGLSLINGWQCVVLGRKLQGVLSYRAEGAAVDSRVTLHRGESLSSVAGEL